mgnify:CR=1 FL=1
MILVIVVFFWNARGGMALSLQTASERSSSVRFFKYGVSSDTDCTILIRIIVKEGLLNFETENMIMKKNHKNPHAIGIDNCRKRLELLYPSRFALITKEENGCFKTYLNIQLR